jgi:hypothetical protein
MATVVATSLSGQALPGRDLEIVIQTPERRVFLMALDEIELDWTDATPEQRLGPVAVRSGAEIVEQRRDRMVLRIAGVNSAPRLAELIAEEEAANPGARGRIVLYEPNRPRSPTTRRLLTRDIAVLLEGAVSIDQVLQQVGLSAAQAVPAAAGAFVIRVESPLAAVTTARALASVHGVRTAYPLLQRTAVTR